MSEVAYWKLSDGKSIQIDDRKTPYTAEEGDIVTDAGEVFRGLGGAKYGYIGEITDMSILEKLTHNFSSPEGYTIPTEEIDGKYVLAVLEEKN